MKLIRVSPECCKCCDTCSSTCLEFRLKIEGCAIRGYDIDFNITQVCTEYHKNQTKFTPPVPRKAVITKMPAIPEVEEQITPVVTKIGPYAIKKTGVQKLIVNPKWSLKRVEMGVQGVLRHNCGCNQWLPQLSGKVEKEYSLLKFAKLSGIMPLIWRGNFSPEIWERIAKGYRSDPIGVAKKMKFMVKQHSPDWADLQLLLDALTETEKQLVLKVAGDLPEDDCRTTQEDVKDVFPLQDPGWDPNDDEELGRLKRYQELIVKGLERAIPKTINWSALYAIKQGPSQTPSEFLDHLRDAMRRHTTLDPGSDEGTQQ
ncbi:hypothetical protein DUI87_01944 [Hirundo rustica rustica]|uniref:Core shell protein Gag P30 domain-containing protein n=1 Tax=Hirundo rustica rustica TaxID=333673 RepID=A0A3M0LPW9_HIRRU|nr:hypothetical protein DUI87_01944 [Hirundo rustica rustica]